MRTTFIETLCELAAEDERIWLLTGDLGYSVLERFAQRFPDRYVNVGVAEQNMTGIAAGLGLCGKIVFTYSIANFPVMRCLEQIRNDVCYHHANVKVVAVGGGYAYGAQGYTHHAIEDLAVMRTLPGMHVFAPGDPVETRLVTRAIAQVDGPCYLRLGKAGEPTVHTTIPEFEVGHFIPMRQGGDALLISTGGMLATMTNAANQLEKMGIAVALWSSPSLQPFDVAAVQAAAQKYPVILTAEEGRLSGGLASAVAEAMATASTPARARLLCAGIGNGMLPSNAFAQELGRQLVGLDAATLCQRVQQAIREKV